MGKTVLEELLIKVGIEIDSKGLKEIDDVHKRIVGSAEEAGKRIKQTGKEVKGESVERRKLWKQNEKERKGERQDTDKNRERKKRDRKGKKEDIELDKKKTSGLLGQVASFKKLGLVVGAALAVKKFNDYSKALNAAGAENAKFARSTGISAKELQAAQFAAERENVSAQEMTGILSTLNQAVGDLAVGGGPQAGMSMIGLSAMRSNGELKTSVELLNEILEATENLTAPERMQRLSAIGVPGLARLSGAGARKKFEDQFRTGLSIGVESERILKTQEDLADAQQDAATAWREATEGFRAGLNEFKTFFARETAGALGSLSPQMEFGGTPSQGMTLREMFRLNTGNGGGANERIRIVSPAGATSQTLEANITVHAQTSDTKKIADETIRILKQEAHNIMTDKEGGSE